MSPIRFSAPVSTIGSWTVLHLPKAASAKFPSRGVAMAEGSINGFPIQVPLEPDGKGSHWFPIDAKISKGAKAKAGDIVELSLQPSEKWPEPQIPADLKKALTANPEAHETWAATTTVARWDWIRSINSTNNPDTRKKRIEVACDKLRKGMKRPCCFNRSMCTEPAVSKGGVLLENS
jgi:Bacteriocin-protection, YdeI or OmpD-Associated/Domain of unknown function (DUF1905)